MYNFVLYAPGMKTAAMLLLWRCLFAGYVVLRFGCSVCRWLMVCAVRSIQGCTIKMSEAPAMGTWF
jgi:hypothetical protein